MQQPTTLYTHKDRNTSIGRMWSQNRRWECLHQLLVIAKNEEDQFWIQQYGGKIYGTLNTMSRGSVNPKSSFDHLATEKINNKNL